MARRKHLAIDLRWIDSSGVGVYIQGIMPGILKMLDGVSVTGIGDRKRIEQFNWSGAANFSVLSCSAARYSLAEQLQLPLVIPSSTDLFFSPYYTVPVMYRGRFAVTVHDMSHLVVDEIVKDVRKRLYAKHMFRHIRRKAALVFTVSEFSRGEYLRLTRGPEQRVITTHNGISDDWKRASQLPKIRRDRYFVCVGNVKPYKNLKRLVDAFLSVCDHFSQYLLIIGQTEGFITGETFDFFERVRASNGRVELVGHCAQADLMSLVAHADALIMPSLYEGFGLPPLEAMACGVPAVVSACSSLPEVCGDAALYFDPLDVGDIAQKLLMIATDANLAQTLKTRGLIRSENFSWATCAKITSDALLAAL